MMRSAMSLVMPIARAASVWPRSDGLDAGAEHFGEIGAAVEPEADHGGRDRRLSRMPSVARPK